MTGIGALNFGLDEFSVPARRCLIVMTCVPIGLLMWLVMILFMRPVYFSALDATSTLHWTRKAIVQSVGGNAIVSSSEDEEDDALFNQQDDTFDSDTGEVPEPEASYLDDEDVVDDDDDREEDESSDRADSTQGEDADAVDDGVPNRSATVPRTRGKRSICGGAPPNLRPTPLSKNECLFGEERATNGIEGDPVPPEPIATRRLHRTVGYTMMGTGCGKAQTSKVFHENDGPGPRYKKNVQAHEKQLVKCMEDIDACTCEAERAANRLPSMQKLRKMLSPLGRVKGLESRYETCAIVGNAGHMSLKEYGKYIDRHDLVVRFNTQPVEPFQSHVGTKTTFRIANHRRSLGLCCRGNFPEGKAGRNDTGVLLWFPASQQSILSRCREQFPSNPLMKLSLAQSKIQANVMRGIRKDLGRLGFTFGRWQQLTSGGHAVLLLSKLCDSISLYGVTTYNRSDSGGGDHYSAALSEKKKVDGAVRPRSGDKWHDWKGEKYAWRLMNAAGKLNICSA